METIEYKNYNIKICSDDMPESPNDCGDDEVFLVGWNMKSFRVERDGFTREIFGAYSNFPGYEYKKPEAIKISEKYYIFGIDAYIHGGISLSLHGKGLLCKWDTSSYVGAVFILKRSFEDEKWAKERAKNLIKTWNAYLNGEVYGFIIDNPNGDNLDSCFGYFGDYSSSGLIEDAKASIDADIKHRLKQKLNKLKVYIKHDVPLEKRI